MSLLKAIKAQLGLSNTPTHNFTLDASAADGTMKLARGNAGATTQDVLTVDSAGVVKTPKNLVAFSAYASSAQSLTGGVQAKVLYNTKLFDTTNAFSTANSRFQPTVAGYYQINATLYAPSAPAYIYLILQKNGADYKAGQEASAWGCSVSGMVYLNGTTDYVEINVIAASALNTLPGAAYCWVDGHLLGAA